MAKATYTRITAKAALEAAGARFDKTAPLIIKVGRKGLGIKALGAADYLMGHHGYIMDRGEVR